MRFSLQWCIHHAWREGFDIFLGQKVNISSMAIEVFLCYAAIEFNDLQSFEWLVENQGVPLSSICKSYIMGWMCSCATLLHKSRLSGDCVVVVTVTVFVNFEVLARGKVLAATVDWILCSSYSDQRRIFIHMQYPSFVWVPEWNQLMQDYSWHCNEFKFETHLQMGLWKGEAITVREGNSEVASYIVHRGSFHWLYQESPCQE